MNDGRSTDPEPTRPENAIPGWRLILSDAGRLWASREEPFTEAACDAGADRTVDGDSLEELRAATDRQETFAREIQERQAREREIQEREAHEQEGREPAARERETPARQEQAGQVTS